MTAYYLLGSAYRDMGDMPQAVIAFSEAAARADTAAADCDYATLFRIYGQMQELYERQHLLDEALAASHAFCRYALLAGDTMNYVLGLDLENTIYYNKGDTAMVFARTDEVRRLYEAYGWRERAEAVWHVAIRAAVDYGQYDRARRMMCEYERCYLFDSLGNIRPPGTQYHESKGRYYLAMGKVDSAIIQFKKLMLPCDANLDVDAYRGMMMAYGQMRMADSVVKYARLFEDAEARYLGETQTQAVASAQAFYNYELAQRQAQKERAVARRRLVALWALAALIIAICVVVCRYLRSSLEQLQAQGERYRQKADELRAAEASLSQLQALLRGSGHTEELLRTKEQQVQQLRRQVAEMQSRLSARTRSARMAAMSECEIIKHLRRMCQPRMELTDGVRTLVPDRQPTAEEWQQLSDAVECYLPDCYAAITAHCLTAKETRVCFLSLADFKSKDIATLLGASAQTISNIRAQLAEKLFASGETSKLNYMLRHI